VATDTILSSPRVICQYGKIRKNKKFFGLKSEEHHNAGDKQNHIDKSQEHTPVDLVVDELSDDNSSYHKRKKTEEFLPHDRCDPAADEIGADQDGVQYGPKGAERGPEMLLVGKRDRGVDDGQGSSGGEKAMHYAGCEQGYVAVLMDVGLYLRLLLALVPAVLHYHGGELQDGDGGYEHCQQCLQQ